MSANPLEELIHPHSIAVVGASDSGRGGGFVAPLLEQEYKGKIYPVNPKYSEIMVLKTYASVKDIPGVVDYVISSVPASQVLSMLDDCSQKGVRVVHLFTARFSETGRKEAAELEQKILRQAKEYGIRLIGPNCLGLYFPRESIAFHEGFPKEPGSVGLASQSGQAVGEIVQTAAVRGIRFSKGISYGNALDFNECDYLEYFIQDPETSMIMMYIEGVRDGRRFFDLLRRATATKPVIIVKGGRGESGTRATASHTASLAGSMQVWETMVNQAGAVSASNLEELVDFSTAFYFLPPISGRRVGVAGGSGGSSVLAADECEEAGLSVIPLPAELREELKSKGSQIWDWIGNPADMSIRIDRDWDTGDMLEIMSRYPDFDLLIAFVRGHYHPGQDSLSADVYLKQYRLKDLNNKPLLAVMEYMSRSDDDDDDSRMFRKMMDEVREKLIEARVPIYPHIKRAARSASKLINYYQHRRTV
jgi:acyl-CoA synthetase (NDP forming)